MFALRLHKRGSEKVFHAEDVGFLNPCAGIHCRVYIFSGYNGVTKRMNNFSRVKSCNGCVNALL